MSLALPTLARVCGRTGARVALSGALAIGLLTSAPVSDAHAATAAAHATTRTSAKARHHKPALSRVERGLRTAIAQKGDPYAYGAAGPNRFDCSGLTYFSFRRAGFSHIPRTSSAQAHFARHISRAAMKRGDLMFFTDGGGVYHVGVFAGWSHGRRLVLHAPYSGTRVRTDRVWTSSWFPGTLRGR
ncbi:C40 family peptidase [Nocardioides conyzicola]|uniref:NlpC/P60 domain-containing protein n=1 Tax=Nocardioides conyzicola TaxID=1651781 RepID=A0ABP8WYP8_9ACTN